jgi:hypothetical protein
LSLEPFSLPAAQELDFEHHPHDTDDEQVWQVASDAQEVEGGGEAGEGTWVVGGEGPGEGLDGGDDGVGRLHGFLPLEQTTLHGREVVDDDEPGLEMALVNCAAWPVVHTQQGSPSSNPLLCPSPSLSEEKSWLSARSKTVTMSAGLAQKM